MPRRRGAGFTATDQAKATRAVTSRSGQQKRWSGRRLLLAILAEGAPLTADALFAATNERSSRRVTRAYFAEWLDQCVNRGQIERDMTVRPWVYRAASHGGSHAESGK